MCASAETSSELGWEKFVDTLTVVDVIFCEDWDKKCCDFFVVVIVDVAVIDREWCLAALFVVCVLWDDVFGRNMRVFVVGRELCALSPRVIVVNVAERSRVVDYLPGLVATLYRDVLCELSNESNTRKWRCYYYYGNCCSSYCIGI